jgi:hypothetical protein
VTGAANNAAPGICYAEVNGVEIGRINLASYVANKPERTVSAFASRRCWPAPAAAGSTWGATYTSNTGTPR